MQVKAVFCDIGGPIYCDENFVSAVLRALDDLRAESGQPPTDRATFRQIYDIIRTSQNGSLRTALAEEFLGGNARKVELHERTREYWHHPPGTMYSDVLPFFRQLSGLVTIGVLANQEASVIDALRRDGLGDVIDVWGISAVVGHEKPSAELFHWCLDQAGVGPGEAVHIGNRLDTDVRPAKALGLHTVWVLRGEAPDNPTPEQAAEPDVITPGLDGLAERILLWTEGKG